MVQRARGGRGIRAADPQASTVCGRFGRRDRARDRRRGRGVRGGGRDVAASLPFPEPGQLVTLDDREEGLSGGRFPASLPEYRDWQREGAFLAASAAVVVSDRTLIAGDQPERVQMALVWGDLDGLTRMRPIVGRAFTPEESTGRGGADVLSLDEDYWRARFGADLGRGGTHPRRGGEAGPGGRRAAARGEGALSPDRCADVAATAGPADARPRPASAHRRRTPPSRRGHRSRRAEDDRDGRGAARAA